MAGHTENKPRWGDSAAIEGILEAQEELEAEEAAAEAAARAAQDGASVARVGQPEFEPTDKDREMVKNMARCNMPQQSMTLMVRWPNGRPISVKTLRKHFTDELVTGHIEVGMQLVGAAYKKAMAGDTGAICFLLKTGYGFRETIHQEVTGKDGAPLQTAATGVIVVPGMAADPEAWEKLAAEEQAHLAQRAADIASGKGA